jgi:hypothetical protein
MKKLIVHQSTVDFVKKSIDFVRENNKPLYMDVFVKEFDREKYCGTVCCIYGWLPAWNSNFRWNSSNGVTPVFNNFVRSFDTNDQIFIKLNFSVHMFKHDYPFLQTLPFEQGEANTIEEVEKRFEILMDLIEIISE